MKDLPHMSAFNTKCLIATIHLLKTLLDDLMM